jgi:hypothetical protein
VVSETSREISDAEAEAYRHLAEHTATITSDPVSEARICRAWKSTIRQLDAGVDWNTILGPSGPGIGSCPGSGGVMSRRLLKSGWP